MVGTHLIRVGQRWLMFPFWNTEAWTTSVSDNRCIVGNNLPEKIESAAMKIANDGKRNFKLYALRSRTREAYPVASHVE